jgi:hypothetical protein
MPPDMRKITHDAADSINSDPKKERDKKKTVAMHYRVKRNRLRKGVPNMYKNYVLTVVLVVLEVRVCG